MKKFLPLFLLVLIFFIFKLSNFGIRLSDTNIYFYTGYKLLQGNVLYRDIFFTNLPLFPYISSLYYLLVGGNLKLFFLIPTIEVSAVALLIYLIAYKKYSDVPLALTSSIIYLFSFIILSTSDHQTGVFIGSLFSIISYYCYLNKRYFLTGIFVALAILTKAYYLPILLAYIVLFIWEKKLKKSVNFFLGGLLIAALILLPTFIFAFPNFIKDLFIYSLNRTQGVDKSGIAWFFATHDFHIFVLLLFSLITIRRNRFFGLLFVFGIAFFLVYKDTYYLYLNFLTPFLCLTYPEFYKTIQKNFSPQRFIVPTILFFFVIYSFAIYATGFRNLQKLNNIGEIASVIKKENPSSLYGVDDITPALSYLTGVPLLNGIIDTNANIFRKGILNSKKLTTDAISQKSLLVTHGASYPEAGVNEEIVDEIFDKSQVKKSCKLVGSFPVQTEGVANRLNLLRCLPKR